MVYTQLIKILEDPPIVKYPVVLPDFFVDHFVIIPTYEGFLEALDTLAQQGGGNLMGSKQFVRRGGNCVNTVAALHALDVNAKMIVTTDEYGASLLKALVTTDLDLRNVHVNGRLSTTVSIETEFKGRRINLMISDSGSASSFGFDDLTDADLELVKNSGLVALVNLNHNEKASDLALGLFQTVKETSNAITFMDFGDPSSKPDVLMHLVNEVINDGPVDILGVNENEVSWLTWTITGKDDRWRHILSKPTEWIAGARKVSEETGISVNLHTQHYSAIVDEDEVVSYPSFIVENRVACGAGDSWNAGNIYGLLLNLPKKDRIILANAIAALYVSSPEALHPSRQRLISFLSSNPPLSGNGKKLLMHN